MLRKLMSMFQFVTLLLAATVVAGLPATTGRVWCKITPEMLSHIGWSQSGDARLQPAFQAVLRAHGVTQTKSLYSRDPISLADPEFHRLQMDCFLEFRLPVGKEAELVTALKQVSGVLDAGQTVWHTAQYQPSDWNLFGMTMWGFDAMQCRQAWDIRHDSSNVLAVTIDTGVDFLHPDLVPNIGVNSSEDINHDGRFTAADSNGIDEDNNGFIDDVIGWDFVSMPDSEFVYWGNALPAIGEEYGPEDNTPFDVHGHGTHVAGSIAARTDNGTGVPSASFNVKTLAIRAGFAWVEMVNGSENLQGSGFSSDFVRAIQYSVNRGARIISISFGGYGGGSQEYQTAINYARAHNCLVLAAAGNDNTTNHLFPAAYDSVMSVAALRPGKYKAGFSNYGNWIDIAAPGVDIWSTMASNRYHQQTYVNWQGTSMATPTAAAAAALFLSYQPTLTVNALDSLIRRSATPLDSLEPNYIHQLGAGCANALIGLRMLQNSPLLITQPAEGARWGIGTMQEIRWQSFSTVDTVDIELNRNYPQVAWETIQNRVPNTGSYRWLVAGAPTDHARIRIRNRGNPSQVDISFADFSIASQVQITSVPTPLQMTANSNVRQMVTFENRGTERFDCVLETDAFSSSFASETELLDSARAWLELPGHSGPRGDDAILMDTLPMPVQINGRLYSIMMMNTNGYVEAVGFDGNPNMRMNVCWADWVVDSVASTSIAHDANSGQAAYTWSNVRLLTGVARFTFQVVLSADGDIRYSYQGSAPAFMPGLLGLTRGDGTPLWSTMIETYCGSTIRIYREMFAEPSRNIFHIPAGGVEQFSINWRGYISSSGADYNGMFRLVGHSAAGQYTEVGLPVRLIVPITGVEENSTQPDNYSLLSAYPNPFNQEVAITVQLPQAGFARVAVYDITGREVAVLREGNFATTPQLLRWNASGCAAGMYFVQLTSGERRVVRKVAYLP